MLDRSHDSWPLQGAVSKLVKSVVAWIWPVSLALMLGAAGRADDVVDPASLLKVVELTAEDAETIVASQSARPAFFEPADDAQLDEQLLAAGATPQMIRSLRRDLAEKRPFGSSRAAQFLARTNSPRWQKVANGFSNYLHLPLVTALPPDVALAIAEFPRALCLPGITELDVPVAEALSTSKGSVLLYGLKELQPDVAAALSSAPALGLRGLKELSVETARELVGGKTELLNLSGIEVISPDLAPVLAAYKGRLVLSGVKEMSADVAAKFAGSPAKHLEFAGLRDIGVDVARQLARFKGILELGGISALTPEMVEALSEHDGHVVLLDVNVRVPEIQVTADALESLVVNGSLQLPVYKVVVADKQLRFADSRLPPPGQAQRKLAAREPAKSARSVTDIMDSPEDYVDGTYTVSIWIDTFWLNREKKILKDGTQILDGYCLQIRDGTRDARKSESLGSIALSLGEVTPVMTSKELARGLQDIFPKGSQYRLDATVTVSRRSVMTTNILNPNAPPQEAEYLLMDITRLEAVRPDGTRVAVDGRSEENEFKALAAAFEAPRQMAAAPPRPRADLSRSEASPPPAAKPTAGPTAEATLAAWTAFFGTALETGPRRDGELESARMARELIRIAQIPLVNVDPAFAGEVSAFIDLQKERMEQQKKHEREIAACDQKWAAKFAEMEQVAGVLGAQAKSLQEAKQAAAAVALLGGAQLTQERNAEVARMNDRWAKVYAGYNARSAKIFNAIEDLQPTLEKKYRRKFVLP